MRKEKTYKFTVHQPNGLEKIIVKKESDLSEAERMHHLGNLINTWNNTCKWAQSSFLHQMIQINEEKKIENAIKELSKNV